MGTWTNADGLYIKYGDDESKQALGGHVTQDGGVHTLEFVITAADFNALTNTILGDAVYIPSNALIISSNFLVETAFAGATATVDFGLVRKNRTTEIDFDGLDAAIAVASLTARASIAGDGALIGTRLSQPALVTARNNTADLTAGRGVLTITYRI
jgi:ketosteroid isomerase-like protein